MDELRFRSQQSPHNEPPMSTLVSPPRNGSRLPQPAASAAQVNSHDHRNSLPRRFTTDSGLVPTLSQVTGQQRAPPVPQDLSQVQTMQKVQLLEKKRLEYERIREQKRRFELEMQKLDQQERREEQELAQMTEDLGRMAGHQSEPTTPPEYREPSSGFPTMFSKPNRYSTSSITSPPGIFNRPGRSGSQLASPQSSFMASRFAFDDQLPARSFPGSRRNSDDDEKEEAVRQDPTSHRSTNALNRYSMPVTKSRTALYDLGLDQTGTTRFLFGDEDTSSADAMARHEDQVNLYSTNSQDIALNPSEATNANGWGPRHRSQQSISQATSSTDLPTIPGRPKNIRHSLDLQFSTNMTEPSDKVLSPPTSHGMAAPKLTNSYSANDVTTAKTTGVSAGIGGSANNHAQQHFHNHNASLGRIPPGVMPSRHSRELSNETVTAAATTAAGNYPSIQTTLHGSTVPFGSSANVSASQHASNSVPPNPAAGAPVAYPGYYNGVYNSSAPGYPVPLVQSMQAMNLNGPHMYSQSYHNYGPVYNQGPQPVRDSQARIIQDRRRQDQEIMAMYQQKTLQDCGGQIYNMCKDQHGCRFLQKQLENHKQEDIHMIWLETNVHVVELMTDPFGNYLCQKLLEFCNDDERTVLVRNASQDLVKIALNQHGTRALQKMIEFINTPEQINLIIGALRNRVVELIQDLNGNHVIQKCLNKLSSEDANFIFHAVGNNCIDVGTHRHGCCVLQRCIDHASGQQKIWLIGQITKNAPILVQDPFGNYVVQYIIDLNESMFTTPLVAQFQGKISALSRHKFSSNVIEKCLRCADDDSKDNIVAELLGPGEMDRLLRDSFANYVIQTALEYATPFMKGQLIDTIRPMLPGVRNTPYGRRISAKITAYDTRNGSAASSGQATPADPTQGQIQLRPAHNRPMQNTQSILGGPPFGTSMNGLGSRGSQSQFLPIGAGHPQYTGPNGSQQTFASQQYPPPPRGHQVPPPSSQYTSGTEAPGQQKYMGPHAGVSQHLSPGPADQQQQSPGSGQPTPQPGQMTHPPQVLQGAGESNWV